MLFQACSKLPSLYSDEYGYFMPFRYYKYYSQKFPTYTNMEIVSLYYKRRWNHEAVIQRYIESINQEIIDYNLYDTYPSEIELWICNVDVFLECS